MELAAKWYGEGRITLVVLHRLLGCADNWKGIARRLSDVCRIACVDMRNHRESPHAPTMTYPEMATDAPEAFCAEVRAFLETLEAGQTPARCS